MAFDECTYYPATDQYARKAADRTHLWAKRCLDEFKKSNSQRISQNHALYGIIQGGTYKDLRKESAKVIAALQFDGIAIGGVSVGETKKEMREQVNWVTEVLRTDSRPRHLLGVGQIDDILDLAKRGIDTFDCVEPTRLARMGKVYKGINSNLQIHNYEMLDLTRGAFNNNLTPIDENCHCYTCRNFTRSYLHLLFKQKELLVYYLATFHNLYFMEKFMEKIRTAIKQNML